MRFIQCAMMGLMRSCFATDTTVDIDLVEPSVNRSSIEVAGLRGSVTDVDVTVRLTHTFTRDVVMILENPAGDRVLLVSQQGGDGDNFEGTTFDDEAGATIKGATAPFTGRFRPEASLTAFDGSDPNGRWTLLIADNARQDGGQLLGWELTLETDGDAMAGTTTPLSPTSTPTSAPTTATGQGLSIEVRFGGGLTTGQQAAFRTAAQRWSRVIRAGGPPVQFNGDLIAGVRIDAMGTRIDGPAGILGQAGPTALRPGSFLPAAGMMQFDSGDLAQLEASGGLLDVIVHEMGHVLGIGTLWAIKGLIAGSGTANPRFTGANANREFGSLINTGGPVPVPVANTGGEGTREGHWRESVFGSELMTGFLDDGSNPLSRMTIASLADLGYQVSFNEADPYRLPSNLEMAIRGIGAETSAQQCCTLGTTHRPTPFLLPDSSVVVGDESI